MAQNLKIGLVGAGLGGMTAAIALQQRGIELTSPSMSRRESWVKSARASPLGQTPTPFTLAWGKGAKRTRILRRDGLV